MGELDDLFKEEAIPIKIYLGKETEIDPFEHTVDLTCFNPIPIMALVNDLTPSKIQWSMIGVMTDKAQQIIIEAKYENLLKLSQKIQIDDEYYVGWRQNGRLQFSIEGNYLRAYIYIKKV